MVSVLALISKKQLVLGINKAFSKMESAKKDYVFSVIFLGEKLLEAKEAVGFGEWESFVKVNSELTFGHEQATKYMKIAKHKELVISMFGSQETRLSINSITKAISHEKATIKANPDAVTTDEEEILSRVLVDDDDDAIEAEFIVVAPHADDTHTTSDTEAAPEDDADWCDIYPDDWEPDEDQTNVDVPEDIQTELKKLRELNREMEIVFADDNRTTKAIEEINKLLNVKDALENRIDSLVNENADLMSKLNYWEARCKKLEKSHAK